MTPKKTVFLASAGLLLATVIWGFAFVVVKNSLDTIPPFYMLAVRFTIASAALAAVFAGRLKKIDKKYIINGLLLGFFLFAAYAFQTVGCKYTTAGKNAFITTMYVVLVPFINWIITKRKPDIYSIAAAVTAFIGIALLSFSRETGSQSLSINKGDILTLICGVCYAIHIVFISKFTKDQDPILLTVLQIAAAALFSWLSAPLIEGAIPTAALLTGESIISMLYLGLLSTMVSFLLQNVCQKYVPPSPTALLLSMESVFGVIFSALLLGEVFTLRMVIGAVIILFAVILSETHFSFLLPSRRKAVKTVN